MTIRHEMLTFDNGIAIRRRYRDGLDPWVVYWCGRNLGWDSLENRKCYANKASARRALGLILRHERELGLSGSRY